MEKAKIPHGRYSKEFREEAVRLVTEGGLSAVEASVRLSLPKSTLENWVRAAKGGKLGEIGKSHRPLTELEVELAHVKRELAIVKMERDILKKAAAYFAKESLHGTR
jgi:transposase